MGLVFVFGDFRAFFVFFAENPRWISPIWPLRPDSPRYGSAAEFAKIIDGVTEAEVRRRGGRFPQGCER